MTVGVRAGVEKCARMTQKEVVKRCPVLTGTLRDCFSSPEALAKDDAGHWVFGLMTPELQKRGYYWKFVEFGTKGYMRGEYRRTGTDKRGQPKRRKMKRGVPARPAHPFFRPGVSWARRQWLAIMMVELSIALAIAGVGKDAGGNRYLNEDTDTAQGGAALRVAIRLDRTARGLDIKTK